jgi:hypothetical protein
MFRYCHRSIISLILILVTIYGCGDYSSSTAPQLYKPSVAIYYPPPSTGLNSFSEVVLFKWHSADKDTEHLQVRYLVTPIVDTTGSYNPGFDIIDDLNKNPWRYQDKWTPWISYHAPGDSGKYTIIGDDEELELQKYYIFAIQARGEGKKVTNEFEEDRNVKRFVVITPTGPILTITESKLTSFSFIGTSGHPNHIKTPSGFALNFRWQADVSRYGGGIEGFRYGWDITDIDGWESPFKPEAKSTPETTFHIGTHTLTVEVIDLAGNLTRGSLELTVIDFTMSRNLLWVDDFFSVSSPIPDYSHPPEYDHDDFWQNICSRATGFDPHVDVFDCQQWRKYPDIETIGNYKNIIWTYSSSEDYWSELVYFIPEDQVSFSSSKPINYLPMYLTSGGHIWTLGRSDRSGGLASVLDIENMIFPIDLKCEIAGLRNDCSGDRSGINSMAYRDYCVTVIDKITARFRTDEGMPERRLNHYDVMKYAYKDTLTPLNSSHPGLPQRLELMEEATGEDKYFNPDSSSVPGGFTYVEIYDPEYWMKERGLISQACFNPMYRMRAKNETSAVNHCTIALWLTKNDHVVPTVASGPAVAAPSFHFGFPLWFFKRSSADSLADVIFTEWGISNGNKMAE